MRKPNRLPVVKAGKPEGLRKNGKSDGMPGIGNGAGFVLDVHCRTMRGYILRRRVRRLDRIEKRAHRGPLTSALVRVGRS